MSKQFGLIYKEKIFGIGLGRTGTKSLARALTWLGYNGRHGLKRGDDLNIVRNYKFWTDIVVAGRYKFLDYYFPEAKFILTVREDVDAWIESCRQYTLKKSGNRERIRLDIAYNRFLLFGCTDFNEEVFRATYHRHNTEVKEHFEGREGKLLVIDISTGEGWEKICLFINCKTPDYPFPHKHDAKGKRSRNDTDDRIGT